jgi:hypothetical protein
MKEATPKIGGLLDAVMIGIRTWGGRQVDAKQVPDVPPVFLLWLAKAFGAKEYARLCTKLAEAKTIAPDHEDYQSTWDAVMMEIEQGLAAIEAENFPYPESKARLCRKWGNHAARSLGISTHRFSRICKLKGDPELDKQNAAEEEKRKASKEAAAKPKPEAFDEDVIDVESSESPNDDAEEKEEVKE